MPNGIRQIFLQDSRVIQGMAKVKCAGQILPSRAWICTWQVLFLSCSFMCTLYLCMLISSLRLRSNSVLPSSGQKDFLSYRYLILSLLIFSLWGIPQRRSLDKCPSSRKIISVLGCNEKAWGRCSQCFVKQNLFHWKSCPLSWDCLLLFLCLKKILSRKW